MLPIIHVGNSAPYLNEILALRLGHKRLKLGCGEGVHQASLGHDQKQHLGASEDGQLVCLHDGISIVSRRVGWLILGPTRCMGNVATRERVRVRAVARRGGD